MDPWAIWLIVAAVLVGTEILSGDFFLLMLGGGAASAALVSLLGGPTWLAVVVFAVISVILVLGVRPIARRALLKTNLDVEDGARASIGRTAVVSAPVDTHGGRIKVGGDEWSAQAQSPYDAFAIGDKVRIVEIRGAHAVVIADYELIDD